MNTLINFQQVRQTQLNEAVFESIARDLEQQGYSINPGVLPFELTDGLQQHLEQMRAEQFHDAGIGRGTDFTQSELIRTDEICWITGSSDAGQEWLDWTAALQSYLNRRLFLGLFSFESHFAHYRQGDFYQRHLDAFKGEANRVLSVVAYLNSSWSQEDGGELVLYRDEQDFDGIKVTPLNGTLVIFLSEEFPHEVLPAKRDRYSVAGWFRCNTSQEQRVDPPA